VNHSFSCCSFNWTGNTVILSFISLIKILKNIEELSVSLTEIDLYKKLVDGFKLKKLNLTSFDLMISTPKILFLIIYFILILFLLQI
jgi:hypothetical protein